MGGSNAQFANSFGGSVSSGGYSNGVVFPQVSATYTW